MIYMYSSKPPLCAYIRDSAASPTHLLLIHFAGGAAACKA